MPTLPFVGRQRECAAVSDALDRAAEGHGSIVLFRGDTGIGKSRLLQACASDVRSAQVVQGACGQGFEPFDATAIVRRAGKRVCAAFIDDAHVATAAQLRELTQLAAATRSRRFVLVVTALGSLAIDGVVPEASNAHRVPVLDDDAIALIVRAACAPRALSGDALRAIVRSACGNPRYALELAAGAPLAPSACDAIVSARERLQPKAFDVLSACSVLGDAFDPEWIAQVAGATRMEVADALQCAQDLGLLDDADGEGWMRFRYRAVREACYAAIASFRRRLLHERAARRLSALGEREGNRAGSHRFFTALGEQQAAIGRRPAAARSFNSAGGAAFSAGLYGPAALAYRRAAQLRRSGSALWLQVQRQAIRAHLNAGDWGGMTPLLTAALQNVDRKRMPDLADEFLRNLFFAHLNDGDRDAAERVAAEIAELPLPEAAVHAQISTLILAYARCYQGHVEEAARLVATIDPDAMSDDEARLRYFLTSAEVASVRSSLEEAPENVDRAWAIARNLSVRGTAVCLTVGTEIATRWSDFDAADRYLHEQKVLRQRPGAPDDMRASESKDRLRIALLRGDLPAAQRIFRDGFSTRQSGRHNVAFDSAAAVTIGMHLGDAGLVDTYFDPELLSTSARKRDAESFGTLVAAFARVMVRRGMERLLRAVLERSVSDDLIDPYLSIQLCAIRYGGDDCAARAMAQASRYAGGAAAPGAQALLTLCEALFARRQRRRDGIDRALVAGRCFEALGWQLYAASAFELAGESSQAISLYSSCGASADVSRLRQTNTRKRRRAPFGAALTPREAQVTRLVAQGRSNRQIADALSISVRTADHHIEAAFSKLGIRARWQLTPSLLR